MNPRIISSLYTLCTMLVLAGLDSACEATTGQALIVEWGQEGQASRCREGVSDQARFPRCFLRLGPGTSRTRSWPRTSGPRSPHRPRPKRRARPPGLCRPPSGRHCAGLAHALDTACPAGVSTSACVSTSQAPVPVPRHHHSRFSPLPSPSTARQPIPSAPHARNAAPSSSQVSFCLSTLLPHPRASRRTVTASHTHAPPEKPSPHRPLEKRPSTSLGGTLPHQLPHQRHHHFSQCHPPTSVIAPDADYCDFSRLILTSQLRRVEIQLWRNGTIFQYRPRKMLK